MKKVLIGAGLITLFSCSKKEERSVNAARPFNVEKQKRDSATAPPWISNNQEFLDKFPQIIPDTLKFRAPNYDDKELGKKLTREEVQLFPNGHQLESFLGGGDFEAVGKFELDENTFGMVARMPGEYSFTALQLFFYDKKKDSFLPGHFELADKLGDAGYSEEIRSWLFWDTNKRLTAFTHVYTSVEKVDPADAVRPSKTNDYYMVTLTPQKFDTVRVNAETFAKMRPLLNRK